MSRVPDQNFEDDVIRVSHKLVLPPAPEAEGGAVKAWEQPVEMWTYEPAPPDRNPLFLERRVYQGSSGRVYPLPVIDAVGSTGRNRKWRAIHLENRYLRLLVLPEIGGRIHVGLDKRTGYDFFYRQNVIKPALVGLAGPWISGGVEFNWPQHHRPATFMPVETAVERSSDGSVTIWCSDHDPMTRMKGMHGICLHPEKAYLEVKVRLFNRTTDTQTFLWWANVATRVHEQYQSFFPHDVRFAADHAKRAVTSYPLSRGTYYGVDYARRAAEGVPTSELPSNFVPDGSYAVNDLGWYANIPVPTSYMVIHSQGDFFGGYDHAAKCGTVAFANHHISPGKKQWTWGNQEFGYAWDRSLTDEDGPYVELMSGVYTDNQPDFSYLAPGETKSFSQYWYPIGDIGVPDTASLEGALRLSYAASHMSLDLQVTSDVPHAEIVLRSADRELTRWQEDLSASRTYRYETESSGMQWPFLEVAVICDGRILLQYAPGEIVPAAEPVVATEPPLPSEAASSDELYLIGLHLEQYRHPTRAPEEYWHEAVRRDTGDYRANHALGRFHLRRGNLGEAERYLRTAIARLTSRNPNPNDGEPHYNLGRVLQMQQQSARAYDALYKSTWVAAWRGPGFLRLAEIDCSRKEWTKALDHLRQSLRADADNLLARNLEVVVLRRLGRDADADALLRQVTDLDCLDTFSRFLATGHFTGEAQQQLDLAFDLLRAGLFEEAQALLSTEARDLYTGGSTMRLYILAVVLTRMGKLGDAESIRAQAARSDPAYVFPHRVEEMLALQEAVAATPWDGRAHFYLGNLLYDKRRYAEAMVHWQRSVELDRTNAVAWRNLGLSSVNHLHDYDAGEKAFSEARKCAPNDARLLYEQDQLQKLRGVPIATRLQHLANHPSLVQSRDDLTLEYVSLLNSMGRAARALRVLKDRTFGPWEGGEGQVLGQYVRSLVLLAHEDLMQGRSAEAFVRLESALRPPRNLGEAHHPLVNLSLVTYWMGVAEAAQGRPERATILWDRAAHSRSDFQQMQVQAVSELTFWSAAALKKLGRSQEAKSLLRTVEEYADILEASSAEIDYFATSLPALLLFDVDLQARQHLTAKFLRAQARLGMGDRANGERLIREVLEADRSHTGALDMLQLSPYQEF